MLALTQNRSVDMSGENTIVKQICDLYVRDNRIPHPTEIAVSERRGDLTLRGTLGSLHQIRAAVEIAKSVPGVEAVHNELSLDPQDRWQDGEIRGAALQALMSNETVPSDYITVHVRDGWLTLAGEVRHQEDSDAAFETASSIKGVGGITNEIKVVTAGIH
jgi:osmotically-inducible protein OsmY